MYAVVKTGGTQYRVSEGDRLRVETIQAEAGSDVSLDEVLMVGSGESVNVGAPLVANASVSASDAGHDESFNSDAVQSVPKLGQPQGHA